WRCRMSNIIEIIAGNGHFAIVGTKSDSVIGIVTDRGWHTQETVFVISRCNQSIAQMESLVRELVSTPPSFSSPFAQYFLKREEPDQVAFKERKDGLIHQTLVRFFQTSAEAENALASERQLEI